MRLPRPFFRTDLTGLKAAQPDNHPPPLISRIDLYWDLQVTFRPSSPNHTCVQAGCRWARVPSSLLGPGCSCYPLAGSNSQVSSLTAFKFLALGQGTFCTLLRSLGLLVSPASWARYKQKKYQLQAVPRISPPPPPSPIYHTIN